VSSESTAEPAARRILVLGTGTEIGKTFVTAALARELRRCGCSVMALKPIETGCVSAGDPPQDSDAWLLEAASTPALVRPHPLYAFDHPVSPHLAARRTRQAIDTGRIVDWVRRAEVALRRSTIQYNSSWVIIETAGGALSPLSDTATNADLARALEPAFWLLVAPDALGVLHDLRATLTALRSLARAPDLTVLSAARPPDASTGTNAAELAALGIATPAAVFERNSNAAAAPLANALMKL
jgi:dethiobiotin synthetase